MKNDRWYSGVVHLQAADLYDEKCEHAGNLIILHLICILKLIHRTVCHAFVLRISLCPPCVTKVMKKIRTGVTCE